MHFIYRETDNLVSQIFFQFQTNQIYNNKGKKETITSLIIGPNKHVWLCTLSNKLGRLSQGNNHGAQYTEIINLTFRSKVPNNCSVTYESFVCYYNPLKSEPFHVHCVANGDKLDYPNDPGSPAASLIKNKILFNSTISDTKKGA